MRSMASSCGVALRQRSAEVDERLQHLVLRLDGLRVGLVDALRGDHVDQLAGQVDVGFLQRAGLQHAEVAVARRADSGSPEAKVRAQALSPSGCRPCGLRKLAISIWPAGATGRWNSAPVTMPLLSIAMPSAARREAVLRHVGHAEIRAELGGAGQRRTRCRDRQRARAGRVVGAGMLS